MKPKITKLDYTDKRLNSDKWSLNVDDIPLPKDLIKDQQIAYLGPRVVGGNHKHPRTEWFIGIGDLVFVWLDENGEIQEEHMHPNQQILLIEVPPYLSHAVKNKSDNQGAVLFEYSDMQMKDVKKVKVI